MPLESSTAWLSCTAGAELPAIGVDGKKSSSGDTFVRLSDSDGPLDISSCNTRVVGRAGQFGVGVAIFRGASSLADEVSDGMADMLLGLDALGIRMRDFDEAVFVAACPDSNGVTVSTSDEGFEALGRSKAVAGSRGLSSETGDSKAGFFSTSGVLVDMTAGERSMPAGLLVAVASLVGVSSKGGFFEASAGSRLGKVSNDVAGVADALCV